MVAKRPPSKLIEGQRGYIETHSQCVLYHLEPWDDSLIHGQGIIAFLSKHKREIDVSERQVTGIGSSDYVGICINIASRLQKLGDGAFSFAFTKKGLDENKNDDWLEDFRLIKITIRGVSKEELVYVLRKEFQTLSREDKKRYRK